MAGSTLRGCFVTGTGTGVGKTVLAASIAAALLADGIAVRALKPLITGLDEPPDPGWPPDHELLAMVCGGDPAGVFLAGWGPPVSPHLAAALTGEPAPSPPALGAWVRAAVGEGGVAVVEGIGGLLVPLGPGVDVRDLARALGLALVIAAGPSLGTLNHTLLTVEAARRAGLDIAGVVLTPWPDPPGVVELSNRDTIAERGSVEVATLGHVSRADPVLLAAAGRGLPLERWLPDAYSS